MGFRSLACGRCLWRAVWSNRISPAWLWLAIAPAAWAKSGPSDSERQLGILALGLWFMLALAAIVFLGAGSMWLIRRLGRRWERSGHRPIRVYYSERPIAPAAPEEEDTSD